MRTILIGVFVMFGLSSFFGLALRNKSKVNVGDPAPSLRGITDEGNFVELKTLCEKGPVLVYFYPKADTPGCTAQACSLRDAYAELQKKGVQILGVSTDSVDAQKRFREKYKLPFNLIADTEKTWAAAFDVPLTFGFASRQAFLIQNQKLLWIDRSASTKEQANDVLKALNI